MVNRVRNVGRALIVTLVASAVAVPSAPASASGPPSPITGRQGQLLGVSALSATDVWAVGFRAPYFQEQTDVWHWDGQTWGRLPAPHPGSVSQLRAISAVSPTDIWAAGFAYAQTTKPLMEHWDGTAWTVVKTPRFPGHFTGVSADAADDVWAIGQREDDAAGFFEHWDGTRWSLMNDPVSGDLSAISAASTTDVWAVGNERPFKHPVALHWDGTSWTPVTPAVPDPRITQLSGVDVLGSGQASLVGYYGGEGGGGTPRSPQLRKQYTLGESWDGSAWTQDTTSGPLHTSGLTAVSDLDTGDGWAVGYTGAPYYPGALVERWDGTQYSVVSAPLPDGLSAFTAVDADAQDDAWAVGWVTPEAEQYTVLVEHWDGTAWSEV